MNNNVLDYNLEGVCDVVHFYKTRIPGFVRMYWDVYAGPGRETVVAPTPPQALVDMYGLTTFGQLRESSDNAHVVLDFVEYNGYDEYIGRSIQSPRPTKEYTSVQYYVPLHTWTTASVQMNCLIKEFVQRSDNRSEDR